MPPVFEDHLFGSKVILIADRKETVESGSLCKNKPLTEDLRSISHTAAAIQQGFRPLEFEAVHSCQLACFAAEAEALSQNPSGRTVPACRFCISFSQRSQSRPFPQPMQLPPLVKSSS